MPTFNYATSSFTRARGSFPDLLVVNMLAEDVSSEGEQPSLISREGLSASAVSMGSGPVQNLYQEDGVLDGLLYGVSGGSLYAATAGVGTVVGGGHVSFAGYDNFLFVTAGESLYGYNGSAFAAITFPDGADVTKVVVGASRAIALKANSQRFYWTEPLDTVFDDLAFASAEYSPDGLKDALFWNDALILFGNKTVEFWPVSSDADVPFQPMQGRVFQTGIRNTGAATLIGASFAWVTHRNNICFETPENVVSFPGLEAKILASDVVRLWTFTYEGNEYLALTLDDETWVLNLRGNPTWSVFETNDANFLGHCWAGDVFGSRVDGTCYEFAGEYTDVGEVLQRKFSAWAPLNDAFLSLDAITMRANSGTSPFLEGDYVDPEVEMRFSKDGGRSFSVWKSRTLGEQGNYQKLPTWNSQGTFSYPGVLAEVRVSDPVDFRVSGLFFNE